MKTNFHLNSENITRLVLFFSGLLLVSCGSYQNSSYYENDGVYGRSERNSQVAANNAEQNNTNQAYQNYFKSKQLNAEEEVFTDVERYSSVEDTTATSERNYDSYAAWGSNPSSVTVNVYDNNWGWNYWNNWYGPGMGMGWGWNNWYGGGWGWNVGWGWNNWYGPGWGWGWNNWYGPGWGHGWYGNGWGHGWHGNYYANNRGRRTGGIYGNRNSQGRYNGRSSYTTSGRTSTRDNFGTRTRNSSTRNNQFSTRNSSGNREYNSNNVGTRNSSNAGTRNSTRSSSPAPSVRNNTPSRSTSSPSYGGSRSNSGGSFGGGRSSGGGGGRSSGGGGGRGRG